MFFSYCLACDKSLKLAHLLSHYYSVVILCHHANNVSRILSVQHTNSHHIAMMSGVSFHVIESMVL